MPSFLEKQLKDQIYKGFKGRLLKGTVRQRTPSGTANSYGDPTGYTYTTYSAEGFVDTYSAFYKAQAGIPETDVRILIIAGSLSVRPKKNDEILFRGKWYKARVVNTDPAEATWEIQAFEIADPTA